MSDTKLTIFVLFVVLIIGFYVFIGKGSNEGITGQVIGDIGERGVFRSINISEINTIRGNPNDVILIRGKLNVQNGISNLIKLTTPRLDTGYVKADDISASSLSVNGAGWIKSLTFSKINQDGFYLKNNCFKPKRLIICSDGGVSIKDPKDNSKPCNLRRQREVGSTLILAEC